MKHSSLYFFALFLVITACQPDRPKVKPMPEKVVAQAFTDTLRLDTFKVSLLGKTSKDMSLLFTITSHRGTKIYQQEIKAETLLKSYVASAKLRKEDEKIKFLNDEVSFFFEEEHFLSPAVTDTEKPDNNTPDKVFFQELQASKLPGFNYSLGKDIQIYIAWSAKEQKVKIYYKCC